MLVLTRRTEESITIGNEITITVLETRGNQVRIGIEAPLAMPVLRTEILQQVIAENISAARVPRDVQPLIGDSLADGEGNPPGASGPSGRGNRQGGLV